MLEDQSTFSMEVSFFDSFQEIKEKLEKYTGIPAGKQTLMLNGNVLGNEYEIFSTTGVIQLLVSSSSNSDTNEAFLSATTPATALIDDDVQALFPRIEPNQKDLIEMTPPMAATNVAAGTSGTSLDATAVDDDVVALFSSIRKDLNDLTEMIPPKKLRVEVLPMGSASTFSFEVNASDNVSVLRTKLETTEPFSLPESFLHPDNDYVFVLQPTVERYNYQRDELDEDHSFESQGIVDGTTIEAVLIPRRP